MKLVEQTLKEGFSLEVKVPRPDKNDIEFTPEEQETFRGYINEFKPAMDNTNEGNIYKFQTQEQFDTVWNFLLTTSRAKQNPFPFEK